MEIKTGPDVVRLRGGGRLGDKTVIMGAPRTGKTTLLKLVYSLLTPDYDEFVRIAKDTAEHTIEEGGFIELKIDDYVLQCGRSVEDGEVGCTREYPRRINSVYLLYEGFELTLKYLFKPPLFQNMLAKMDDFVEKQRGERYSIFKSEGAWYENFGGRIIPLSNASNAVAIVGYLERLSQLKDGWILIDGLLDGLYPEEALYAAGRLIASKAKIVVVTHSPWVKDLFLCHHATLDLLGMPHPEDIMTVAYEIKGGLIEPIEFSDYGAIYKRLYAKC